MSLFKLPAPHPNLNRNGYDLSSRRIFSAPAGALLPIATWEANPGEKFRISVQDLVRAQPLNTAAFARCKEYYHFFFVPYKSLWQHSDRFFTGVTEGDSAFSKPDGKTDFNFVPKTVPMFNLKDVVSLLHASTADLFNSENLGISKEKGVGVTRGSYQSSILDDIHSGTKTNPIDKKKLDELIEKMRLALPADLKPYYDRFVVSKLSSKDALGYLYKFGAFRLLHFLGYGVDNNGFIVDFNASYVAGTGEIVKNVLAKKTYKLPDIKANVFRLLAYQRIYNDFYRNDLWEAAQPDVFNVDWCCNNNSLDISDELVYKMCQLRYRHWSKDWVTSAYPTASYDKGIFELPDYVNGNTGFATTEVKRDVVNNRGSQLEIKSMDAGSLGSNNISYISPNDIRAMFALEKMLERTRAANGLDYSNQIAAHFGFKVPESRKNCASFIGGFDNQISISEVVTTSNGSVDGTASTGSVVGQVFGKGIGAMNSGHISYDVKEHGLIMCIYSIAPQVDYDARELDPFNRKFSREDYFQPEFENLGMQPVIQSDLCLCINSAKSDSSGQHNNVLGYSARYLEYKTARDIIFGEFMSGGSLSAWATPKNNYTFEFGKLSLPDLLVDPKVLEPIFAVKYNGSMSTDQFLVNSYFDVKAIRPMQVNDMSLI